MFGVNTQNRGGIMDKKITIESLKLVRKLMREFDPDPEQFSYYSHGIPILASMSDDEAIGWFDKFKTKE